MGIANRVFDAQVALGRAEDDFDRVIAKWLGRDWWEEPALCENISFDQYDASFELHGCPVELRWAPEVLPLIWAEGFKRCWINHIDGTETAYVEGGRPEGCHRVRPGYCPTTEPPGTGQGTKEGG
jgi:hypothetical protein